MKNPIEYKGERAILNNGKLFNADQEIPSGESIDLCGWCKSDLTPTLHLAGYILSHGMCELCSQQFLISKTEMLKTDEITLEHLKEQVQSRIA